MKLSIKNLSKTLLRNLLLVLIIGNIVGFLMALGVHAAVSDRSPQPLDVHAPRITLLQTGQQFYQSGRFLEAINTWKAAADEYRYKGDSLSQSLGLSYLALAYQQLGEVEQATKAMNEAIALIAKQQNAQLIVAQVLNNQGQFYFSQGQSETALETWKKAEQVYRNIGDRIGEIGTQLNQARALQALGFYLRAKTLLEKVATSLNSQPDSQLKVTGLLNLGNILRVLGDFNASKKTLEQGLAIAQKLQSLPDIEIALFSLGNLAQAREQPQVALQFYQQASGENSRIKLQAEIYQLELLVKLERLTDARSLFPKIQTQLANFPPSQTKIYAQIDLAESLVKLSPNEVSAAAKILASAANQAKSLGNPRAESYAMGRLGALYEQTQQWDAAKNLTQQALILAQQIRATEIAYLWQWQTGRLLKQTGDKNQAVSAYTDAVKTLQSLRQDLAAINQDVQLSFRESVEPVYRELVDLLLQNNPSQAQLQQARLTIEALQLAELANFFREACLDVQPRQIDQIDPTAAVIYPIILSDRTEVILSLPGQPLRLYTTKLPKQQVETVISRMRQSMRRTAFAQERLNLAQQIYGWLIKPAVKDLTKQNIQTLVFVLDGALRNIPMAALHDGEKYLIEQYKLAIAPGLQLLNPRSITQSRFKALLAGLTEGNEEFSPLPGVKAEVTEIGATVPATILLDQQFTTNALETKIKTLPFSVMHLATHGQFSSKAEKTFVLTWDGRIDVKELSTLLTNRELTDSPAIELLVLSACQTAKGDNRAALGLAGVAVRSGARSTLASLWMVNDKSTAEFMVQFYQELLKPGMTKAEAVRRAQLQLLKQPEFNHPYFWASFILVGSWL
jgi:CHAT domain-containing protein